MDFALHPFRQPTHGAVAACRGRTAFALLLVLMLTAVLGGAVLATQLIVQQRLRTIAHRNLRYQQVVAADAALRHILATVRPEAGTATNITVAIPLPDISRVRFEWKTAPTSDVAIPPGARRIRAAISDDNNNAHNDFEQDYIIWRDGEHWHITRW